MQRSRETRLRELTGNLTETIATIASCDEMLARLNKSAKLHNCNLDSPSVYHEDSIVLPSSSKISQTASSISAMAINSQGSQEYLRTLEEMTEELQREREQNAKLQAKLSQAEIMYQTSEGHKAALKDKVTKLAEVVESCTAEYLEYQHELNQVEEAWAAKLDIVTDENIRLLSELDSLRRERLLLKTQLNETAAKSLAAQKSHQNEKDMLTKKMVAERILRVDLSVPSHASTKLTQASTDSDRSSPMSSLSELSTLRKEIHLLTKATVETTSMLREAEERLVKNKQILDLPTNEGLDRTPESSYSVDSLNSPQDLAVPTKNRQSKVARHGHGTDQSDRGKKPSR